MRSETETRLRVILTVFIASFGLLAARLFFLQVIRGEELRSVAEANRTQMIHERAPRGMILDRNGDVLADNRPTFVVIFTPLELQREVLNRVIDNLAEILGLAKSELTKRLRPAIRHASAVRLMDRVPKRIAFALAEQRSNLPGISVVIEMQRRYPHNILASHVMGYLGKESSKEKQGTYRPDSLVGITGLEKIFDKILRGQDGGMRLEVDAMGKSLKVLDSQEPSVGYEVRTTLNLAIQKAADQALLKSGKSGAVVAIEPRSGDILAIASSPSYDPNTFVHIRGEDGEEELSTKDILSNPDQPLYNRAIKGSYPPGSIFKIIDSAAALESKKWDPNQTIYCKGSYLLEGAEPKKFHCWKKKGHKRMNLKEGLVNSCNVYFYRLGLKVGPDALEDFSRQFGLGEKTGIELAGEYEGYIPGRGRFKSDKRRWYDGDTLNMSIGQGTVLFTPLQAAQMMSVVASRGKLYRPHLIKEIRYPTGEVYSRSKTQMIHEVRFSADTWDFLHEALTQVVERGTGYACKIPGVKVAGKTGTAQNPQGKDHAWFVAFAPVDNPTIAVSVLVEHGLKGSVGAAPIAREVILASLPAIREKLAEKAVNLAKLKELGGD